MKYDFRSRTSGFTLIELLVVMGIILVLAGIVVGVQRGVYYQQSKSRALAEMRTIATGLESFKSTYGDYPPMARPSSMNDVNAGKRLFAALTGRSKLVAGSSGPTWDPGGSNPEASSAPVGRVFIEENSIKRGGTATSPENYWVDPWGNTYNYYYKTIGEYGKPGWGRVNTFILVSAGPRTSTDPAYAQTIFAGSSEKGPDFEKLSNIRDFMDGKDVGNKPRKEIIYGFGN